MTLTPVEVFADGKFSAKLLCNLVAVSPWDTVAALSAIGPESSIRFLGAALQTPANKGAPVFIFRELTASVRNNSDSSGYEIRKAHLGYDTWQLLAITKYKQFLLNVGQDELWRTLHSDAITTPLLRSWMPTLQKVLVDMGKLTKLECVGCNAAMLHIGTSEEGSADKTLDAIVMAGVKGGQLKMVRG